MDKEMMEQLQLILGAIEASEKHNAQRFGELEMQIKDLRTEMQEEIHASETRTRVFIENEVVGELHSLFDGYRLTHEKQWEMEKETQRLKRQVDDLQTRLEVLESKIAGS